MERKNSIREEFDIAVIGMSGRFPESDNISQFWNNIKEGKNCIKQISEEELLANGVDLKTLRDPNYVNKKGILNHIDLFDAAFFGYSNREAVIMDPQLRLYHECVWEAMEDAGYESDTYKGIIGVYSGASNNFLWEMKTFQSNEAKLSNPFAVTLQNNKDFISTKISYNFNFNGPSFSVYSACSTSMVAIHEACQGLLSGDCDMAVAGGASVVIPQNTGYMYEQGMIFSKDGFCRPFDEKSNGTIFGNGVGVVILKRAEDAIADHDHIYAIVRGTALNNDGNSKVGFTAPSVQGQSKVISDAQKLAEVDAEDIGFVEAHGTGTYLGDEIEIKALKEAFHTNKKRYCYLGSVKANVGHLDAAAGVTGFIKTVLAVNQGIIPPMANFSEENVRLQLEQSPFKINQEPVMWKDNLRTAGVSSFGVGGTNAHAIIQQAPAPIHYDYHEMKVILPVSGKTEQALNDNVLSFYRFLKENPEVNINDLAFTLQSGRKAFNYRTAFACIDVNEAVQQMEKFLSGEKKISPADEKNMPVVFMFPGQGGQYVNMCRELYDENLYFCKEMDACFQIVYKLSGMDLKEALYPKDDLDKKAFEDDSCVQIAILLVEYCLSKLFMHYDIVPDFVIGYSFGEYVAAVLKGVFRIEDAIKVVIKRSQIVKLLPEGGMLSVPTVYNELKLLIYDYVTENKNLEADDISIAIDNGDSCVVSGMKETIKEFKKWLLKKKLLCIDVNVNIPAHSKEIMNYSQEFKQVLDEIEMQSPNGEYISGLTGDWLNIEDISNSGYWVKHLCGTIHFTQGIEHILERNETAVFIEMGPGRDLSVIINRLKKKFSNFYSIGLAASSTENDEFDFYRRIAKLWSIGYRVHWSRLLDHSQVNRISLPTYQFQRQSYWLEEVENVLETISMDKPSTRNPLTKKQDLRSWFYEIEWNETAYNRLGIGEKDSTICLVFVEDTATGNQIKKYFDQSRITYITVKAGAMFEYKESQFTINPLEESDYHKIFTCLQKDKINLEQILFSWGLFDQGLQYKDGCLYQILYLAKALRKSGMFKDIDFGIVTSNILKVKDTDLVLPDKTMIQGLCKTIPQEYTNIHCKLFDVCANEFNQDMIGEIYSDLCFENNESVIAYREEKKYLPSYVISKREELQKYSFGFDNLPKKLRNNGVYLITGGTGHIGSIFAEFLAKELHAVIIIIGRMELPKPEDYDTYLADETVDEATKMKIRRIQKIAEYAAHVEVLNADISDEGKVREKIQQAEEKYGKIYGVIHAAGILNTKSSICPLDEITQKEFEIQYQPKRYGLNTLDHIFKDRSLDFKIVISSLAPLLGGLGFSAYACANCYADGFANSYNNENKNDWISVNWGDWQPDETTQRNKTFGKDLIGLEITPEEGIKTLLGVLELKDVHEVIISSGDFNQRFNQWVKRKDASMVWDTGRESSKEGFKVQSHPQGSQEESIKQSLLSIWRNYYKDDTISSSTNYFEYGATSLDLIQIKRLVEGQLGKQLSVGIMFQYSSISQLAEYMQDNSEDEESGQKTTVDSYDVEENCHTQECEENAIAVIGIAGRYPGASNPEELWNNIKSGKESISRFTEAELEQSGVEPSVYKKSNYVNAKGIIDRVEYFDAGFFDYSPRDAMILDPQIRIFHECAWEALEDAGYIPENCDKSIGLYAGATPNLYWELLSHIAQKKENMDSFSTVIKNDKDFLSMLTSHKLSLNGPSMSIFTGCSTSLVAIDTACKALLSGKCDMALAGATCITLPNKQGYVYEEGMIYSKDGHCKSFDKKADGTVFSNAVSVVLLKPLKQAKRDRDHIYMVIKATEVNNDGSRKSSFTAPSITGQSEVITKAFRAADVHPEDISYVEAHGTATKVGDIIELQSLQKAFHTDKKEYCYLGTLKTNVGHLEAASGVTALIKTALMFRDKIIPPLINHTEPLDGFSFQDSPFVISRESVEWNSEKRRCACINSLGIGGTNAFAIVEEPEPMEPSKDGRTNELIILSARSSQVLDTMTENFVEYMKKHKEISLADVAYTLQAGRKKMEFTRTLVCSEVGEAIKELSDVNSRNVHTSYRSMEKQTAVFMFPGQGSQYLNMGYELYETEKTYRDACDKCFRIIAEYSSTDYKGIMFSKANHEYDLSDTMISLPMIFITEYALSQLMISWGIVPAAVIGYSFGEYAAAVIAGIFTLQDALKIVMKRCQLIQTLPEGSMISVPVDYDCTKNLISEFTETNHESRVDIAIDNEDTCVVSGDVQSIQKLEGYLKQNKILCTRVATRYAAHSHRNDPIIPELEQCLNDITFHKPAIKYISGIKAESMIEAEVCCSDYWIRHTCNTVTFVRGIKNCVDVNANVFIEAGPGKELCMLLQRLGAEYQNKNINLMRMRTLTVSDQYYLIRQLALLWEKGIYFDLGKYHQGEKRCRISLPTYPFDEQKYWIEGNPYKMMSDDSFSQVQGKNFDLSKWFYRSVWKENEITIESEEKNQEINYMVFADDLGFTQQMIPQITKDNDHVVYVSCGSQFIKQSNYQYTVNPDIESDYEKLFQEVEQDNLWPDKLLHCWNVTTHTEEKESFIEDFENDVQTGFFSLLYIVKNAAERIKRLRITIFTNYSQKVVGDEEIDPGKNTILSQVLCIPQEYNFIHCKLIDILYPINNVVIQQKLYTKLNKELQENIDDIVVAYRGTSRWILTYEQYPLMEEKPEELPLVEEGTYVITGGFGGIGLILANYLASNYHAKLALIGRSGLPSKDQWMQILQTKDAEDKVVERINAVLEIEKNGGTVLALQADVSDMEQLKQAIKETEAQFGRIRGVIHAAGIINGDSMTSFQNMNPELCWIQFASKVYGTIHLYECFKRKQLDFCLLMSSISTVLGGLGYTAYTAANCYLNAFAEYCSMHSFNRWISIDWSDWKYWSDGELNTTIGQSINELSMLPQEGIQALRRILSQKNYNRISCSPGNLQSRIAQWTSLGSMKKNGGNSSENDVYVSRPNLTSQYRKASSAMEGTLEKIWSNILMYEEIGVDDNFFELGGDSLKAIMVISNIRKEIGVNLSMNQFFDEPTIAQMAKHLEAGEQDVIPKITKAESKEYYRASIGQKRIYILQQIDKNSTSYNAPMVKYIKGNVDCDRLTRAFNRMIERHESLRTSFHEVDGEIVQRIHKDVTIQIETVQLEENSPIRIQEAIHEFIQVFDLSKAPLLRVKILHLSEEEYLLLYDIHHIIADGISSGIFIDDLTKLYDDCTLEPLKLQYKDFSEWQNQLLQSKQMKKQEDYWLNVFARKVPDLDLPLDYPRSIIRSFEGDCIAFEVEEKIISRLHEIAKNENVTMYMILLAAYNVLLSTYSGQEDICVGLSTAGRQYPNLEHIIGMFVNTLVMRNYPTGTKTFREFLAEVKDNTLSAFDNQDYQYDTLVEKLKIKKEMSRTALFDTMFTLQNMEISDCKMNDIKIETYPFDVNIAKFDLNLNAYEQEEKLYFYFEYCTKLFKCTTVEQMISKFIHIILRVTENIDLLISEINLNEKAVQAAILTFNEDLEDE